MSTHDFDGVDTPDDAAAIAGRAPAAPPGSATVAAPTVATMMEAVRQLVDLHFECEADGEALAAKKKRLQALSELVLHDLQLAGLRALPLFHGDQPISVKIDSQFTVNRTAGTDSTQAVAALRAAGLGDLVHESYNAASLKATVVELLAQKQDLAPAFLEVFEVGTFEKLAVVRTTRSTSSKAAAARHLKDLKE